MGGDVTAVLSPVQPPSPRSSSAMRLAPHPLNLSLSLTKPALLLLLLLLLCLCLLSRVDATPLPEQHRQQRVVTSITPSSPPRVIDDDDDDDAAASIRCASTATIEHCIPHTRTEKERERDRRAQFWAGWPKTTVTLVQTVTILGWVNLIG